MLFTFNILFGPLYKNNKSVATFGGDSFYLTFYEMVYAAPCISLFFCPDLEVVFSDYIMCYFQSIK